ncbi:hypothetical protein ACS0TY_020722 [Phlomoides rotata]
MADQYLTCAISSAEQFLMQDENHDHPLLDDFVNEMVEELGGGGNNVTLFPDEENLCDDHDQNQNTEYSNFPQFSEFGNPIRIPIWPIPPSPHCCTGCQTLREIFHVNGNHVLKLHIHGRLGLIAHAVLEKYINFSSENREYHMFDFCEESIMNVKQFLVEYCDDRKREGYIMLQDPLCNFYNALCTGLYENSNNDILWGQTSGGDRQTNQEEEEGNGVRSSTSYMALQRERTGNMKVRDLVNYFHLPINDAAKELNICSSAIKSICRKENLPRWPYRKIKSIQKEISRKQQSLNSHDADERENASKLIPELQRQLDEIYRPFIE